MSQSSDQMPRTPAFSGSEEKFRFLFFSELMKRPICAGKIKDRIGKLTDLVFALKEPYPEVVAIYLEHGWGKPTELIPWEQVLRIEDDAIFVRALEDGGKYPPFVDQAGWILLNEHLMGRTVLDMDGRRVEVVNDIHLLEANNRLVLVHVDMSFNGFLRRWGLGRLSWIKDDFVSWRYIQPLSFEDAESKDKVSLSVTRKQLRELPSEDLADALEELRGKEQEALFSALDSEKAADTLMEAEPRARRQLIGALRKERASLILDEMTVPQLVNLFSVLPHEDVVELMSLLHPERVQRIKDILSDREVMARDLMDSDFVVALKETRVGEMLDIIRRSGNDPNNVSYIYVVADEDQTLAGVVDLRELVLASDEQTLGEIMTAPVVTADGDDIQEDLAELFAKYHFRMVPVVDPQDRMLGVIRYKDIMKGPAVQTRD